MEGTSTIPRDPQTALIASQLTIDKHYRLEDDLEELLAFYDCPAERHKRLRTTNVIERLFVEVRRRIRTMCAFTTGGSCERLLFSVFDRMNNYWSRNPLRTFTQNS